MLTLLIAVLSLVMIAGAFAQQAPPSVANPAPVAANSAPTPVEEDIRDIRGPISIPYPWLWAAYAGGGLVLLALLYAAWRHYRRQSARRAKLPFEIALERLETARALLRPETAREYSFEVSEITRQYIEQRFHEHAPRRTTEEFLRDLLERSGADLAAHRGLLEEFLHHCDLAKFARWQLTVPEMEAMHESARAFVLSTKPEAEKTPTSKQPPSGNGSLPHAPTSATSRAELTPISRRP